MNSFDRTIISDTERRCGCTGYTDFDGEFIETELCSNDVIRYRANGWHVPNDSQ